MPFDNGDPHGLWEWFDNGKLARTIRFDHTEVLQIDDRPINDPLGRACRLGKIDNYVIRDMLSAFGVCDFRNTPLKDVVDFISENYAVSMAVDRHSLQNVGVQVDTPITLQEDQVTTGAMLVLLFEPHDLAATYRFGMIWITTKDNARNWVDRTGIAELLKSPPAEILPGDHDKIRAALEESAQFDFVETPLQRVAESLSDYHRVPFDCDPTIKDMLLESYFRGLSLQNALGALCDQYGLRIRWKDGNTLVIEPQEGAENWRPRR
jgi:hypothetical protein